MTTKKKLRPVATYTCDVGFYSIEVRVRARTAAEARKKMKEAVKRRAVSAINNRTTFVTRLS